MKEQMLYLKKNERKGIASRIQNYIFTVITVIIAELNHTDTETKTRGKMNLNQF